jgi:hypothetical protein
MKKNLQKNTPESVENYQSLDTLFLLIIFDIFKENELLRCIQRGFKVNRIIFASKGGQFTIFRWRRILSIEGSGGSRTGIK